MSNEALISELDHQRRKVDFDTYDIIVQQLVSMIESGAIDVAPAYQRQFRWDGDRRSQLVESVFLGVPVPSLFMAANKDGTWELVDGVQRLSTLVQFSGSKDAREKLKLDAPLLLQGLTKLTKLNGKKFADLPDSLQLHFKNRPVKVITLSDKSDSVVRFDLFERLNTGGIALSNQEIRACIYRGPFNALLEKLAIKADFKKVLRLTEKQEADGTREECVLRFFAYLHRYKKFEHSVTEFLNEYMGDATKTFDYDDDEKVFNKTFRQLTNAFPKGIVRGPTRKITPLNLYEAVSVGAALALQTKASIVTDGASKWIQDAELRRCTTAGSNNPAMVTRRIQFCRDRFLGK